MLNKLEPIGKYTGADCLHLSVFNILKYKAYLNFEAVWKQCGLSYTKHIGKSIGSLKGKYIDVAKELEVVHGIEIISKGFNKEDYFIQYISDKIFNNEPVILYVNTYDLKGNMFYEKKHMEHTVILVEYASGKFTYVDDAYNFKGNLSTEELLKATLPVPGKISNNMKPYRCSYINIDNTDEVSNLLGLDYKELINLNNSYLKGTADITGDDLEFCDVHIGIESIFNFISDYKRYFNENEIIERHLFETLYSYLAEVANTRYRYSSFLKSVSPPMSELRVLSELYQDLGQNWQVSANMMIKGMFAGNRDMLQRMLTKVESIYHKETETLDYSFKVQLD